MILALDPGETTGVCIFKSPTEFRSREIKLDLVAIGDLIKEVKPKIIVYERFVLYPAFAKHLVWDEMYTSQVIGVIKYEGQKLGSDLIAQSASDKDYVVYPKDHKFRSDHEKDAYGHAWFYTKSQSSI